MQTNINSRLENAEINGLKVILIHFEYSIVLRQALSKLPQVQWSKELSCWYTVNNRTNFENILAKLREHGFVDYRGLVVVSNPTSVKTIETPEIVQSILLFKKYLASKRYSVSTIKVYSEALTIFLSYFKEKPLVGINNEDLLEFNNNYILRNNYSSSYQNQVINAVKLFFRKVRDTHLDIEQIHRPKRSKNLPNVLSKNEVKQILNAHRNLKHATMLSLIYACGLRRSELLNLLPLHIQSDRNLLLIKEAKGKKDRVVPISNKMIDMLRAYYKAYKPKYWLFEGQVSGEQYSEKSLQSVLKQALVKARIKKPVTLHWLRHSYATHLLESGTDLRYIQEILGHKSSKTTEIYTHVSMKNIQNIKSPFDDL